MRKFQFFGASAFALIAAASPAFAQATAPQAADTADEITDSADIIVTASKRAKTLQDTPISVAVTTSESIERSQIRDLLDLQTLVPSLKVGQLQSSANTNFIIRGFGNGANNAGIEPSVAVFIDGVYRSRSGAQIADLPNIERVEVLRGPQSTLFGKNASAGVISIVTAEPKFEFGGNVEASYGNFNAIVVKGTVTGPLSEQLAVSLSGSFNKRDGYARYTNLNIENNNRNRYGVRGQVLFQPSSDFKIRLIADYDKIDEICCTVANFFAGPTAAAIQALTGGTPTGPDTGLVRNAPYSYNSFANIPSVNKIDTYGFSAQIDANLTDTIALTSITAYRGLRSFTNQDSDFSALDSIGDNRNRTAINTYTQELRLASDFDGPLNFLLGGYFFKEDIDINAQLLFGRDFRNYANALSGGAYGGNETLLRSLVGLPAATPTTLFGAQGQGRFEKYKYNNDAISLFGNIEFEITDGLTLTLGGNYTVDRKKVVTNNSSTDVFSSIDLVQAFIPIGTATQVGQILNLGRLATPAEIGAFAQGNPAVFAAVQAGVGAASTTAANPFLGLRPLQFLPPFLNFPNAVESGKTKDDNFSYTIRLAYKFNRNINAYATYATGFKASSFNLSTDSRPFPNTFIPGSPFQVPAPAASPIRTAGLAVNNLTTGTRYAGPEDAQVYEVGVKGNFQGFSFNLAVFKQILKGFQSNVFVGTGFVLGNAEKQSTQGFELDFSLTPIRRLNFTASVTYLDPKFDSFAGGTAFNPLTNNTGPANLTGLKPSGVSDWSIAVGTTYTLPLGGDVNAIFHVDYDYSSAFMIAQGLPFKAAPETLNASLALELRKGLEVAVWGRNLTEPKYNPVIFPGVAQSGTLSAYPSGPKTYGVSARFKF